MNWARSHKEGASRLSAWPLSRVCERAQADTSSHTPPCGLCSQPSSQDIAHRPPSPAFNAACLQPLANPSDPVGSTARSLGELRNSGLDRRARRCRITARLQPAAAGLQGRSSRIFFPYPACALSSSHLETSLYKNPGVASARLRGCRRVRASSSSSLPAAKTDSLAQQLSRRRYRRPLLKRSVGMVANAGRPSGSGTNNIRRAPRGNVTSPPAPDHWSSSNGGARETAGVVPFFVTACYQARPHLLEAQCHRAGRW